MISLNLRLRGGGVNKKCINFCGNTAFWHHIISLNIYISLQQTFYKGQYNILLNVVILKRKN